MAMNYLRKVTAFGLCLGLALGASSCSSSKAEMTSTSSPSSKASPTKPLRSFTVVSSGDLLLHERLWNQAIRDGKNGKWDFYPQLADISSMTKTANLALCHLETPLAPLGGHYTGYPVFNSPPQIVTAVKKLGFDMCDQTSNHSFDAGSAGIKRTLDNLDKAGIAHTGTYRSEAESKRLLVMDVSTQNGPVKVGILAFTYGFNGFPYPDGKTWLANKINLTKIKSDAKALRTQGADIVILKLHWGTEYTNYPNKYQTDLAKAIAKTGLIDLIDGDHTHSVQPIQKIENMWVIYSHGNLAAAQREPETIKSEGVVTRWTFTENKNHVFRISKAEFAPTLITDNLPVRILDVKKALKTGKWVSTTKTRLQKALLRTSTTIRSMGAKVSIINNK
jgi:poly-gamma-glutamate synthesis protein (capsule biosynthesis protein)